ncbi:MAG: flagellar hook capping FlgD N-terminal domain-containing protein [Syntrophomonadaceae bacterium]
MITRVNHTAAAHSAVTGTAFNKLGQDDFLKIFAAELRNQNPTEPMNSMESITQLAQFSSVEQMLAISNQFTELKQHLEDLFDYQVNSDYSSLILNSAALIGKNITGQVEGAEVSGIVESIAVKDYVFYAVTEHGPIPLSSVNRIS